MSWTESNAKYRRCHDVLDMHHRQIEVFDVAHCHRRQGELAGHVGSNPLHPPQQGEQTEDLNGHCECGIEAVAKSGEHLAVVLETGFEVEVRALHLQLQGNFIDVLLLDIFDCDGVVQIADIIWLLKRVHSLMDRSLSNSTTWAF